MKLNFKALSNGDVLIHRIRRKLDHSLFRNRLYFSRGGRRCNFLGDVRGNSVIKSYIMNGKPFMAARHGSVELNYIINNQGFDQLCSNAGFFPQDQEAGKHFREIYKSSSELLDVLSVWNYRHGLFLSEQKAFFDYSPSAKLADLSSLSPFLFEDPWSAALRGKKVLVIHPFSETIKVQYLKRNYLFSNLDVLPEFKCLKVLKAVQTIAGTQSPFEDWFDALEYMKE